MSETTIPRAPGSGASSRRPSALRILHRLCWRFRSSSAPRLGVEVMAEQLARQEKETVSCAKEATKIEGFLQTTRQALTAALTDDETPGVITQAEADEIARVMMRNASAAHAHTKHLNALL